MNLKGLAAVAAIAAVAVLPGCATSNQQWHKGCTVKAKDVLYSSSDGTSTRTKRLTTSCGSFNVEDAIEVGHFTSWDIWQAVEVGETYDLFTGGPRIGWLSAFPVVLEVKPAA
ncbi:hypothetical protein SEA_NIKLAS_56 [Mycobacterium Phage Niklas]|uniref:Uncharacterized protein n=1 Tax=Mycobacterium Phage Niklas TaxID=2517936 RepID=A0A482JG93_9CAUD|nr:secreted protein [Mycobacterium Phage Niklas]ASR85940.1 hypothetical protein SEA_PEANAM_56 [Mycobacterium phage Peanam]QAY02787.1 hypothetical protein SEA_SHAOBING_56 [Mycobacterium phage Shaobing]QBP31638.1 hypothetical protein SEA_NIKLAS_56 [Mycobacterium Phage Niklas]